jgi:hypothetical protein
VQPAVEQFQKSALQSCRPKQTAAFTKNVIPSRWSETFPRKSLSASKPSNILPQNGTLSSRQTEVFPRDVKNASILTKSKHAEILPTNIPSCAGQMKIVQRNTATLNYRTSEGSATTLASSVSSIKNINKGNYYH